MSHRIRVCVLAVVCLSLTGISIAQEKAKKAKKDKKAGNYPPAMYRQTTRKMDEFFASLGYLEGPPTLGKE